MLDRLESLRLSGALPVARTNFLKIRRPCLATWKVLVRLHNKAGNVEYAELVRSGLPSSYGLANLRCALNIFGASSGALAAIVLVERHLPYIRHTREEQ
jgi:hypothetical protein